MQMAQRPRGPKTKSNKWHFVTLLNNPLGRRKSREDISQLGKEEDIINEEGEEADSEGGEEEVAQVGERD